MGGTCIGRYLIPVVPFFTPDLLPAPHSFQISKLRAPQQRLTEADPCRVLWIGRFNDFILHMVFVSRNLIRIDDRRRLGIGCVDRDSLGCFATRLRELRTLHFTSSRGVFREKDRGAFDLGGCRGATHGPLIGQIHASGVISIRWLEQAIGEGQ